MLFMDLVVNNIVLYQGQFCPGQVFLRDHDSLGFVGGLMFVDTQGLTDPVWSGLGTRYALVYFSDGAPMSIPMQATPIQNFSVVLGGQTCIIGLYEQLAPSEVTPGGELPFGADEGYMNQAFLAAADGGVYAIDYATGYYAGA